MREGSTTLAEYSCDGEGRRVKRVASGETTYTVYDTQGRAALEYQAGGSWTGTVGAKYWFTDHLGSTRMRLKADGTEVSRTDYEPFGAEIVRTGEGYGGSGENARKFTGKERDAETGLDYFGARYVGSAQGRFTTPDPVMLSNQRMFDPQQWNMYSYSRNNPLSMIDPDGREVRALDDEALNRIRSTVPENLRSHIRADKKGLIDKKALGRVKTRDQNFNDLRTSANASATLEVATAPSVKVGEFGETEFFFTSKEQVRKERDELGVIGSEPAIDQLFLGYTDQGPNGATRVTLSDGTGKSATTPMSEQSVTAAHEIFGHGLPKIQGRPWKHDDRGPIDRNIKKIEDRTRRVNGKP